MNPNKSAQPKTRRELRIEREERARLHTEENSEHTHEEEPTVSVDHPKPLDRRIVIVKSVILLIVVLVLGALAWTLIAHPDDPVVGAPTISVLTGGSLW